MDSLWIYLHSRLRLLLEIGDLRGSAATAALAAALATTTFAAAFAAAFAAFHAAIHAAIVATAALQVMVREQQQRMGEEMQLGQLQGMR